MTAFYIGTAGWSYLKWDREFYPKGTKADQKLAYYATRFNAVELNNSFYHTPSAEQFRKWQGQVPAAFRFAIKASRYITHTKKLKEPETTLPAFLEPISLRKPGPVFFQLPPTFPFDPARLERFLKQLPGSHRYAIELRDPSWHCETTYALLRTYKTAFCLYDTPEGLSPREITTDFTYLRLRGRDTPKLTKFLQEWARWLTENTQKAHVFFDNRDQKNLAFGNALAFQEVVG